MISGDLHGGAQGQHAAGEGEDAGVDCMAVAHGERENPVGHTGDRLSAGPPQPGKADAGDYHQNAGGLSRVRTTILSNFFHSVWPSR